MIKDSVLGLVLRGTQAATKRHVRCSFCGRGPDAVNELVSGPSVYICDACVDIANRIIADSRAHGPKPE
jgi:ATP-dependent Clp protease ATP-binding subunit ClpX